MKHFRVHLDNIKEMIQKDTFQLPEKVGRLVPEHAGGHERSITLAQGLNLFPPSG